MKNREPRGCPTRWTACIYCKEKSQDDVCLACLIWLCRTLTNPFQFEFSFCLPQTLSLASDQQEVRHTSSYRISGNIPVCPGKINRLKIQSIGFSNL